jgi:uncharacterized protein YggU (UPF0235/DUF167 family)
MADLELAVTPRAATDRVGPYAEGVLRVRVTRPPADGEANRSVLRLVARALGVPPRSLRLVAGERARRKRVSVDGLDAAELGRRLAALGGH